MPKKSKNISKRKRRSTVPRSIKEKSEITYLRSYNTITSSAGGVISPIYLNTDPFSLGVQGFANFAALYRTYRVLKIIVVYTPNTYGAVNNVLVTGSPIIHGTVRKATAAPTSYSDVQGDQSATLTASNQMFVHKVRAVLPDELLFVSTGTPPTNIYAIECYANGYAATTNYGSTLVTYKVEFYSRYF